MSAFCRGAGITIFNLLFYFLLGVTSALDTLGSQVMAPSCLSRSSDQMLKSLRSGMLLQPPPPLLLLLPPLLLLLPPLPTCHGACACIAACICFIARIAAQS